MAFSNMWRELVGTIPNLSAFLAQTYIRRAWRDICDERSWSFKQATGVLVAPVNISTGTVAVVAGATTATPSPAAQTAFIAQLSATPPFEGRQFRVVGVNVLLTIEQYDQVANILYFDQPYPGITNAAATYQVYQAYFTPPDASFQKWISIYDPNNGYPFTRYHVPKAVIDRMDPTRGSQGMSYWSVDYGTFADGTPRFEFWPHPTQGQTFETTYLSLGTALTAQTDTLPAPVPEGLVVARALSRYAIGWGIANASRFPELKGINWALLKSEANKDYLRDVQKLKLLDDGRNLKTRITKVRSGLGPPADSNWMQSHDWPGRYR